MKTRSLIATASLSLLVGLALATTAAFADPGRGAQGGGDMPGGGRPPGSRQHGFNQGVKGQRSSNHHGFQPHHRVGPFFPWGVVTVWAPPLYYGYGAPAYYPPPGYYGQVYPSPLVYGPQAGGSVSVALAPPPPNVIQFPNGRYEMRGDGMTTPYTWVWVPNPPPPPPARPPAPPGEPLGEQPTAGNGSPPRPSQIYRWIDEQGVVHLTNRPDAIPTMYRTQAKYTPPS
jgi:Domain of unknown function (DUF4124)